MSIWTSSPMDPVREDPASLSLEEIGTGKMRIQRLFIYPVKSLLPVEVAGAELTSEGFRFDRSFVLVKPPESDEAPYAEHFTIKTTFSLCLLQPSIDETWSRLKITHTRAKSPSFLEVPLLPSPVSLLGAKTYQVTIFGTVATGVDMGDEAASFFGQHLSQPARLLYIAGSGRRDIPGAPYASSIETVRTITKNGTAFQPQRIRFSDAAPLMLTTSASEADVRGRLPTENQNEDVIKKFRSNIHIETDVATAAYDEDDWRLLRISSGDQRSVVVKCIFGCVRCLSLNVDLDTGGVTTSRRQLYGLLAKDRRVNRKVPHKPVFGQYALAGPANVMVRVGDLVEVIERA